MDNIRSILLVNDFVLFSKLLVIYCIKIKKKFSKNSYIDFQKKIFKKFIYKFSKKKIFKKLI